MWSACDLNVQKCAKSTLNVKNPDYTKALGKQYVNLYSSQNELINLRPVVYFSVAGKITDVVCFSASINVTMYMYV